jgi:hypothetical protein
MTYCLNPRPCAELVVWNPFLKIIESFLVQIIEALYFDMAIYFICSDGFKGDVLAPIYVECPK